MPKKASAKVKKAPARAAKTKKTASSTPKRGTAAAGKKADKYSQAGAPWWKQYLPK